MRPQPTSDLSAAAAAAPQSAAPIDPTVAQARAAQAAAAARQSAEQAAASPAPAQAPRPAAAQARTAAVGQPQAAGPFRAQPVPAQPAPAQSVPAKQPAAAPVPARAAATAVAAPAPAAVARKVAPPPGQPLRRPVSSARPRSRHWLLLLTFLIIVVLPTLVSAWYLWTRATDQYVSTVGFSVRREDSQPSGADLLGGLVALGGTAGASDTDILYQFIRSPDMVETVDKQLDLRRMFSEPWPHDFVFGYDPKGTIEDLTTFWQRQVQVYYDNSTGLITLNVSAFQPADSQKIAEAILAAATIKINDLSSVARSDAMKLATEELEKTRIALTTARQDITAFRIRTQIVDPQADLAGQMGVLTGLQSKLAEQLIAHDMLSENAKPTDNRVIQSQQKIDALRGLIEKERNKFSQTGQGPDGESYAQLMADYEKLSVDREFAEGAYRSARINYEASLAEAQRQSRYLATHITPRVAESSTEPNRLRLLALCAGVLLIGWSILALVYYSVRDRK
ncbi:capsule biosynthesis protein [Paracoccus aminophilus]|uniref:capsule biosynthesis protein n=1 Tax=Paracoccus aminophilus TaxID=34003 RepID=UPI0004177EC4|nr:capsule biosynthesis protein [Paracoccus aminophilus]